MIAGSSIRRTKMNSQEFENIVKDLCAKTKTTKPIIAQYNLRKYSGWCSYKRKIKRWRISYHPKVLIKSPKYIYHLIAHEIGHIKAKGTREKKEFMAELFALRIIKRYCPKYFTLKFTKRIAGTRQRIYGRAFKKVLETIEK